MTNITDEQKWEAVERINKQEADCLRMFKNLWGKRHPYDNTRRYLDVRIYLHGAIYELRHLRVLRSALEPKVVTEEQIETMWQSTCDCFTYYHESYRHLFVKALLEWFKELGIAVKEDK